MYCDHDTRHYHSHTWKCGTEAVYLPFPGTIDPLSAFSLGFTNPDLHNVDSWFIAAARKGTACHTNYYAVMHLHLLLLALLCHTTQHCGLHFFPFRNYSVQHNNPTRPDSQLSSLIDKWYSSIYNRFFFRFSAFQTPNPGCCAWKPWFLFVKV